jgi:hypothetical protein
MSTHPSERSRWCRLRSDGSLLCCASHSPGAAELSMAPRRLRRAARLEVSATYPSDFNAARFLDSVRKTVSGCQHPVTAWDDNERRMTVDPTPLIPGSPDVARWATNLSGHQWICDFAVIAKANVVSQIVTCSPDRTIDIQPLVTKRLKEIQELLNSTA